MVTRILPMFILIFMKSAFQSKTKNKIENSLNGSLCHNISHYKFDSYVFNTYYYAENLLEI